MASRAVSPTTSGAACATIVAEVRPKGMGVIVRTAAEGASQDDIAADIDRLKSASGRDQIEAGQRPRTGSDLREPPLVLRVIREHFTSDFRRLLIDDPKTYAQVLGLPRGHRSRPGRQGASSTRTSCRIFERFHVEDQLRKALDRKVWLPSGGHIVIDRTEALTVIDVNTGRFVGHSNLEETVLQNNLEAAEEIARQLRLRDIGGIIVIDFIDMEIAEEPGAGAPEVPRTAGQGQDADPGVRRLQPRSGRDDPQERLGRAARVVLRGVPALQRAWCPAPRGRRHLRARRCPRRLSADD